MPPFSRPHQQSIEYRDEHAQMFLSHQNKHIPHENKWKNLTEAYGRFQLHKPDKTMMLYGSLSEQKFALQSPDFLQVRIIIWSYGQEKGAM